MKRWLVVLLVGLAVIILVSPGIVGRLAEQNVKRSLDWAQSENQDVVITEEAFDRGWFIAEGRHRIELRPGEFRTQVLELAGRDDSAETPALIVDTRIDHGLVPVTSMARAKGSLMPGLASTVSRMQLDFGDGEMVPVPGTLYSRVALSGESISRYLLEAGAWEDGETDIRWDGADVSLRADPSLRDLDYHGILEPVVVTSGNETLNVGQTGIEGSLRHTEYGFSVGSLAFSLAESNARTDAGDVGFARFSIDASSDLEDGRVNGSSAMLVEALLLPGFGNVDVAMDLSMSGLDARSLGAIASRVRAAQRGNDPDAALADLYPQIEDDVQALLSGGAEIRVERFDVALPQGDVTTKLLLQVPQSGAGAEFSWSEVLLAMTATADLRIPVAVMEFLQSANPESGTLIGLGILKKDGDAYVVRAEYQKGLLTVNGAPMPIPLPGQ